MKLIDNQTAEDVLETIRGAMDIGVPIMTKGQPYEYCLGFTDAVNGLIDIIALLRKEV